MAPRVSATMLLPELQPMGSTGRPVPPCRVNIVTMYKKAALTVVCLSFSPQENAEGCCLEDGGG